MKVDPSELVDSTEVAALLGLSSAKAVSTYRSRYSDFPDPLITKGSGRCMLWMRRDVEKWATSHARHPDAAPTSAPSKKR
jgi:predicted DNA-binding transcriptional regulator AlpA